MERIIITKPIFLLLKISTQRGVPIEVPPVLKNRERKLESRTASEGEYTVIRFILNNNENALDTLIGREEREIGGFHIFCVRMLKANLLLLLKVVSVHNYSISIL